MPVPPLLGAIAGTEPGHPRLTWYGPDDERIELSGHVLDNWVTKTTNLLVEEFSVGPGTVVLLDLPVHWRTVVWALAVLRCGACVVTDQGTAGSPPAPGTHALGDDDIDLVVTDRPGDHPEADALVAVALPALARTVGVPLPAGAVDAASAVMTYGDILTWVPEGDPAFPALRTPAGTVSHALLLDWAASTSLVPATGSPERVLLGPAEGELEGVLATALTTWAGLGSVVLCDPSVVAALAADPARAERLRRGERITAPAR